MTSAMKEMFDSGEWELKMKASMINPKATQTVLQAGSCILEKHYKGQQGDGVFGYDECSAQKIPY